jgi:hypothetical protein
MTCSTESFRGVTTDGFNPRLFYFTLFVVAAQSFLFLEVCPYFLDMPNRPNNNRNDFAGIGAFTLYCDWMNIWDMGDHVWDKPM